MYIQEVKIENFKCFKGEFNLTLNKGTNILVGDNETGKSTILEAIHLALTGMLNGKYLKNELTQYLFNQEVMDEYLQKTDKSKIDELPYILIEIYFGGDDTPLFEADGASKKEEKDPAGFAFRIGFSERFQAEYEELAKKGEIKTLPIEYYDIEWRSFARDAISTRSLPIKSALIDSSSNRFRNGSDIYISKIIKDLLNEREIVDISQAHRKMKESFMGDQSIKDINDKIKTSSKISHKDVTLSVDLSTKNAWEESLLTYLDRVPFHFIGKGEQCIVKTKLALAHKKSKEANVILLEEPENHLSHSKLNELIHDIKTGEEIDGKQIIISTHSSFVANKLGLENLIFLNNQQTVRLNDLAPDTQQFFEKLPGYDTLRLILCKRAILVEGDSDELIVQKAYMLKNTGKLPIQDRIDVISVRTSFLRFLEIAKKLQREVIVVTDNDGDPERIKKKYSDYLDKDSQKIIKICFDETIDAGNLTVSGVPFNYNTLEPKMLKANTVEKFNSIFGTQLDEDGMHVHMKNNKTECALRIFDTKEEISFPQYILDAIS